VYSIISHATWIIFHHALMLALYKSLISCALWLTHKCDVMAFRVYYYVLEFATTRKISKSKARRSLISLELVHSFTPFWIFITTVAKSHYYFLHFHLVNKPFNWDFIPEVKPSTKNVINLEVKKLQNPHQHWGLFLYDLPFEIVFVILKCHLNLLCWCGMYILYYFR
jgi:hypothetical protein